MHEGLTASVLEGKKLNFPLVLHIVDWLGLAEVVSGGKGALSWQRSLGAGTQERKRIYRTDVGVSAQGNYQDTPMSGDQRRI